MKTITKTVSVYQTLDMKVFHYKEDAEANEQKILDDFNTNLNLTKYIIPGEIFCRFDVDKMLSYGTFIVIKVEAKSVTVVDEYQKVHTSDFSNWNPKYLHQIYNHFEYCRGWKDN